MNRAEIEHLIAAGAAEAARLHGRIHETFRSRDDGPRQREAWVSACAEFHSRYDSLAFPGGYEGAVERLLAGDAYTVEATVCFLEAKPYFHRSGYMFSRLLRKAGRAPLSAAQAARLQAVVEREARWREERLQRLAAGMR